MIYVLILAWVYKFGMRLLAVLVIMFGLLVKKV